MSKHVRRFVKRLGASLLALLLVVIATTQTAAAAGFHPVHYPYRGTGFDISWPQCGAAYPAAPFGFAIVGVTDGRANTQNPCLASEFAWARQGSPAQPSLYMNLNYGLISSGQGITASFCRPFNTACQAYAYGERAATSALAYAASVHAAAPIWWLDIELGNTWSNDTTLNAQVIAGAVAVLHTRGLTAGIYCTPYQWSLIAGSYLPHLPVWSAGAPARAPGSYCSAGHASGGGPIWLTQYANGNYDGDWSC